MLHAGVLEGLFFFPANGGYIFLQNVDLHWTVWLFIANIEPFLLYFCYLLSQKIEEVFIVTAVRTSNTTGNTVFSFTIQ
jgi:hypothetical protein